jgi:uncharacterized membrane protein YfcA
VRPTWWGLAIGFATNFLDTLGIGSFATTTAAFKARRMVADERIPGTLNVGHTLPTFAEAAIFITVVRVDALTLWALIAASVAGAWLGAGVISRWSRRAVQRGMAAALVLTGVFIALRQLHLFPPGGDALALHGLPLVAGILGNFAFGALMTLGVGLYAPCMGMVSLLGMNPTAAFPIMMGSCAFLMPVASVRFIRAGAYDRRAALGLAVGGVPGVLIAVYLVKSLPLDAVRWLVVAVVLYTAVTMWRSSLAAEPTAPLVAPPEGAPMVIP